MGIETSQGDNLRATLEPTRKPEQDGENVDHETDEDGGHEIVPEGTVHKEIGDVTQAVKSRLITAALPYINNVPHLGHIVGSHLPADIFARHSRQKGIKTLFIGGSDEHGTPSELAAEQLGIDHKTFCDVIHGIHARIYEWFGISYDNYSRTSSPKHKEIVQQVFAEIFQAGHITKETIEMFYDPEAQRFLADRYIEGTCANCGFKEASGDQCEVCTHVLDPKEIIDPKSKLTGATPKLRTTEHLFLDLGKFEDQLRSWIETRSTWRPQVRNLALGWLDSGLKKRSITRDLKHGIQVPAEGMEDKVLYVWFEAPIAYISFLAEIEENWRQYWEKEAGNEGATEVFHFLGKDNIPFHTIFWPAILMAAGKYKLPDHVEGMQYLTYEGAKFSKSKKRGVFCETFLDSDVNPDLFRAYLALIIPEKSDTEFSWSEFQITNNKMLCDVLSNFVHRSSSFNFSKFGGKLEKVKNENLTDLERDLIAKVNELVDAHEKSMDEVHIKTAFKTVFDIASLGNKYIDQAAPWSAIKTDPERAKAVIFVCSYISKVLATLLVPFLPDTATKIWDQLNLEGQASDPANLTEVRSFDSMPNQLEIKKPQMLFVKLTNEQVEEMRIRFSAVKDLKDFFN
ncbi:MAG: methionine--tRNA ligase [Candidatus Gracilibacteria bacterium]|jgi:methionyl-tRNA synthetase